MIFGFDAKLTSPPTKRHNTHENMLCLVASIRLAQWLERRPQLLSYELRLFPSRKVATFGKPVVVDQVGIGSLDPTARGRVYLLWKYAHGNRDGDVFRREEPQLVFPIQTRRRDRSVCEPENEMLSRMSSRVACVTGCVALLWLMMSSSGM